MSKRLFDMKQKYGGFHETDRVLDSRQRLNLCLYQNCDWKVGNLLEKPVKTFLITKCSPDPRAKKDSFIKFFGQNWYERIDALTPQEWEKVRQTAEDLKEIGRFLIK